MCPTRFRTVEVIMISVPWLLFYDELLILVIFHGIHVSQICGDFVIASSALIAVLLGGGVGTESAWRTHSGELSGGFWGSSVAHAWANLTCLTCTSRVEFWTSSTSTYLFQRRSLVYSMNVHKHSEIWPEPVFGLFQELLWPVNQGRGPSLFLTFLKFQGG